MAFLSFPSLQRTVAVKTALTVYKYDITYFFDEFMGIDEVDADSLFHISERQKTRMRERKKEISEKLSTRLPPVLLNMLVNILEQIVVEVYFWVRDHFYMIKHIEKRHNINNLCWKSEGRIDRIKTAERLIRNESIDKRVRFVLACIYFLEDDIKELWKSMKAKERENISRIDSNVAVRFWMELLSRNSELPWTYWSPRYLNFGCLEPILNHDNKHRSSRIRLSSFFFILPKAQMFFFLYSVWPRHAHIDDLILCYYQIVEAEREKDFYLTSITEQLLCLYLEWPLQADFLNMLDKITDHIPAEFYENLLQLIVDKKLSRSFRDYNCHRLLQNFWNRIPSNYRSQIQEKRMFIPIRTILENLETENSR